MIKENTDIFLKIHPDDNVAVAFQQLKTGTEINLKHLNFIIAEDIQAKHKFALEPLQPGAEVYMYGILVGKATQFIPQGGLLSVNNLQHATSDFALGKRELEWNKPIITDFTGKTFNGFHRADGSVGTANYWLVIPLVFCENRNIDVLKEALTKKL